MRTIAPPLRTHTHRGSWSMTPWARSAVGETILPELPAGFRAALSGRSASGPYQATLYGPEGERARFVRARIGDAIDAAIEQAAPLCPHCGQPDNAAHYAIHERTEP